MPARPAARRRVGCIRWAGGEGGDVFEELSEDDGRRVLEFCEEELGYEELTEEEIQAALLGEAEIARGEFVTGEGLKRKYGL